ncbi:Rpn family recombination-promoting nuclease/putative transposase (plasmid) [Skermanella sp. TT6]|uniref:Rpn family recombination-promoting nuclease/putative transposase n=1 Tax=Skermanella cutis TaxID=2775420 RepID=A0ABX7BIV9_9PROT|nr:Rpn family recombination-promoting nuclease/putative transposase [Skermanella sp. TT6]QQP93681.1 Rpn family recombination-promoting nuclease/putative transposase [Skermanella sp. TT6]
MQASDSLYHRLFSDPVMIEQLVRGFLPAGIADMLDFTRLERVNAKFHAARGDRREGDVIWRVPTLAGEMVHIYLMLEFQSTPERFMPVRVQVYSGLLWQQIIDGRALAPGGRLPPLLPIVLYAGEARWDCPADTTDLVALPEDSPLWPWQPQVRYHLIDEKRLRAEDLARHDSLVALLFRIEICDRPEDLPGLVAQAVAWFAEHPGHATLRLAFGDVVAHAVAGLVGAPQPATAPMDIEEVQGMLAERIKKWEQELLAKGVAEGKAEGIAEGEAKGIAKGRAALLKRQFTRRFGTLPADVERLIDTATPDQHDAYMDRLMDAQAPGDVFPGLLRPGE